MKKLHLMIIALLMVTQITLAGAQTHEEDQKIKIDSVTFFIHQNEVIVRVSYSMESITEFSIKMFGDAPIKKEIQKFFGVENLNFREVNEKSAAFSAEVNGVIEPMKFEREVKNVSFVFEDGTKITLHNRSSTPRVFIYPLPSS